MSTNIIDVDALSDLPVSTTTLLKVVDVEGWLVEAEDRDGVLHWLVEADPAPKNTVVYTTADGARYWSVAPLSVDIVIVPSMDRGDGLDRTPRLDHWAVLQVAPHMSFGDAYKLAIKPPARATTANQQNYDLYQESVNYLSRWLSDYESIDPRSLTYSGPELPLDQDPFKATVVRTYPQYAELADRLSAARIANEIIGIDVETDEEENVDVIAGIGFSFGRDCYYLPVRFPPSEAVAKEIPNLAQTLMEYQFGAQAPIRFKAHGAKYDMRALVRFIAPDAGEDVQSDILRRLSEALVGDGMIAAYVLADVDQYGRPAPKDLKYLTAKLFDYEYPHYKDMLKMSDPPATKSSEAPLDIIGPYCCADSFFGVKVEEKIVERLGPIDGALDIYLQLELPNVSVLADMELRGLPFDPVMCQERIDKSDADLLALYKYMVFLAKSAGWKPERIRKMCGYFPAYPIPKPEEKWVSRHGRKKVEYQDCEFCDDKGRVEVDYPYNPGSGVQLSAVIQGAFELPTMSWTDSGETSNDEVALLKLREYTTNPDAKEFITTHLVHAKLAKTRGTYWEAFMAQYRVDYEGIPRIHPTFNQTVVESGRLSSKDPNAQNIQLKQRDMFHV